MSDMWLCRECRRYFGDTTAAIEHAAANEQVDIWPVHRTQD